MVDPASAKAVRGVTIDVPGQIDPLPIQADATQLQQLLYNLFNNAADATRDRDRREIAVTVSPAADQSSFQVTIADTGVGFDPERLNQAFQERFTTKPDGHGFGLVVCKRIVDNHGGQLEVESAPNQGARITITFPISAQAVPADADAVPVA